MWLLFRRGLASIAVGCGHGVSFLTIAMVAVMFTSTLMSQLFNINFIALQESVTWLHAAVFMLGAAYTLQRNEHVRVDIFYSKFSPRTQAIVDILGTLLFLFPMCGFILYSSISFVELSWRLSEGSAEAGGLPGVFLLKTLIWVMPVLIMIEGLNQILRNIDQWRHSSNHTNTEVPL
ncbi:TRAP transporter small permease subunit [Pleionea litopenaei]|uniref:TRAP transporter small permease protein n=1 Tax=Pleionea litopenaei TaxID=3070815 RepID=A0AA51X5T2_9GAMM|nr:TRAP transporter small permease subunit [Pleionea sp. HL-JVS1]WMS86154.1 TRAP transporter small permease subunit [Pleionea sp. HL-JVS1]